MTTDRGTYDLARLADELGEDGVTLLAASSVDELRRLLLCPGPRRTSCVDAELLLRAHHTAGPGALETARHYSVCARAATARRNASRSSSRVRSAIRTRSSSTSA